MKIVKATTQFRKDIKRYASDNDKLKRLYQIVALLEAGEVIPKEYRPHLLKGNYNGYWECHIKGDFLLIWCDADNDIIWLHRLGSHSELFG